MGEEDTNSFFVQLEQLTERLKHRRLAEVFRTISFHASETYGPHAHLRIEINYVKRGSCILHLEDESVLFREGDIMIILSNVPHTFEAGQQGTTLLQLEFLPEIFSMFGPHDRFGSFSVFTRENRLIRICNHIRMMRVIQRIVNELNGRAEYFQNLVVLYYAELLLLIYRHLDEIYVPMGANEALRHAIAFIRAHVDEDIKVSDISANIGISERYLRKLFVDSLHIAPLEYLNQLRVNRAIELMKNSELTVKEVCFQCGFSSPQQFARIFKSHVGIVPSHFKK